MIARIAAGFRTLGRFVRQFFCRHEFRTFHVSGILTVNGPCRDKFDAKHCRKCGKTTAKKCKPNKY